MPGEDARPVQDNFYANEFGLLPPNPLQIVKPDFLQVFGYNFGWDRANKIWRALGSDPGGNLKYSNGTQNAYPPSIQTVEVTGVSAKVLSYNALRRYFTIEFATASEIGDSSEITVTYPNINNTAGIVVPLGFLYVDDSWSGDVYAQTNGTDDFIVVSEYF